MADQPALSLEHLTRDMFAAEVGSVFEIPFGDGSSHPIELAEARAVFAGNRDGQRQPFALTFLGAKDSYLRQGTYPLRHPRLGELSFFIVPLGPAPASSPHRGRIQYEAVFT
jgi:hypothetical protein